MVSSSSCLYSGPDLYIALEVMPLWKFLAFNLSFWNPITYLFKVIPCVSLLIGEEELMWDKGKELNWIWILHRSLQVLEEGALGHRAPWEA